MNPLLSRGFTVWLLFDLLDWGEEDPPDEVSGEALNTWLFNTDTVDQMLKVLMTKGHQVTGGDRQGG